MSAGEEQRGGQEGVEGLVFAASFPAADVLLLGSVLIGVILALAIVVFLIRRWSLSTPGSKGTDDWSLQHLREMKSHGQITDDEFEVLKKKVLAASHSSVGRKDGAAPIDAN